MDEHVASGNSSNFNEGGIDIPSIHHENEGVGTVDDEVEGDPIAGLSSLQAAQVLMNCMGLNIDNESFIQWNKDHDWSQLIHSYPDHHSIESVKAFEQHILLKGSGENLRREISHTDLKNPEQKMAHDSIVTTLGKKFGFTQSQIALLAPTDT